jgi:hypothetical protein
MQGVGQELFFAGENQVLPAAYRKAVIIAEGQGAVGAGRAVGAEETAAKIKQDFFIPAGNRAEGAAFLAAAAAGGAFLRRQQRPSAEALGQDRFGPGEIAGPVTLSESFTEYVQHLHYLNSR